MTKRTSDGDYEVGYGRPPKSTRFKPGQSGNPRGRPKGAKGVATVLRERLLAKVTVTERGRQRTITVLEAIVAKLIKGTFDGDSRSMDKVMKLLPLLEQDLAEEAMIVADDQARSSAASDRAVLKKSPG